MGVQIARDRFPAVATVVERDDDDYQRLWRLVNENNGGRYDRYQAKTNRPIPIVRLTRLYAAVASLWVTSVCVTRRGSGAAPTGRWPRRPTNRRQASNDRSIGASARYLAPHRCRSSAFVQERWRCLLTGRIDRHGW